MSTIDSFYVAEEIASALDDTTVEFNGVPYTILAAGDSEKLQKVVLELIPHHPALPTLEFALTASKPRKKDQA